jgi:hypothetical protein
MFCVGHPHSLGSHGQEMNVGSRLMNRLLIPLNKCRHQTLYQPWKCEDERHGYEK